MFYKKFHHLKLIISFFLVLSFLINGFLFSQPINAQEESSSSSSPDSFSNLRILYQGKISDSEGNLVKDGKYDMRFGIYDSETGGNILWREEYTFYNAVFVKDGQFKVILGGVNPISLNFKKGPFWIGVMVGTEKGEGEITWDIGTEPRKKIITLSEFLGKKELTEEEWKNVSSLIKEKLGDQSNLVILVDLGQVKNETAGQVTSFGSQLYDILQNFINFISQKISEIGEGINKILAKLEEISSSLIKVAKKVDVLYKVLIVDKNLVPKELPQPSPDEGASYTKKEVENLIFKEGETSIKIFNQTIKKESLISISFLDNPGSTWWISEKVPGHSFTISLKEPAFQDLKFNYWILNKESSEEKNQPSPISPEKPPSGEGVFSEPEITSPESTSPPSESEATSSNSGETSSETTSTESIVSPPEGTIIPETTTIPKKATTSEK